MAYLIIALVNSIYGVATMEKGEFIITYSGTPDSFDPLEFDRANNLNLARCLYATPLEFNQEGELTSTVLSKFEYSTENKTVTFKLKKQLLFADGTPIKNGDLLISLKRMLIARPDFPVISKIVGLKAWLREKVPLRSNPSGIRVSDDKVEIIFSDPVEQPLFRFTLELFSIIPESCVDLVTNKINCSKPSESGRYMTSETKLKLSTYNLVRRSELEGEANLIKSLSLSYLPLEEALANLKSTTELTKVLTSTGEVFFRNDLDQLKRMNLKATPLTWHFRLKANTKRESLKDRDIRKYIIDFIRTEIRANCPKTAVCDESIFSKLVPGYVDFQSPEFLLSLPKIESSKSDRIKARLPKQLTWISTKSRNDVLEDAFAKLCEVHNISCTRLAPGTAESTEAIANGTYDFIVNGTGFWALDPFGDIKMLFTPQMHKVLQDLAEDTELQAMIEKLNSPSFENKNEEAKKLNIYIHEQYIYNVFAHFSFVFLSDSDSINEATIPQSGTLPSPWMFF